MGTESSSVNFIYLWKTKKPGQVKSCGAEIELQFHRSGESEKNDCLKSKSEEETEKNL